MSIIIIALPKPEDAKKLQNILARYGFLNTAACKTAAQTLMEANRHTHGLVISGYKLSDMHYKELAALLPESFEFLLVGTASVISQAEAEVMSLTMPFRVHDLVNTVDMQLLQLERRRKKEKKQKKKRSEQEQNYINNAKFLLMERNHLTEEDAYRYIQKCSMDSTTGMVETAQMILTLIYDEV